MTSKFGKLLFILAAVTMVGISSCKKDNFSEPSHITADPNLDTISIAHLKSLYLGGLPMKIDADVTISGVVTADDRSGNFYKTIVIQDNSGAIPVLLEQSSGLYTDFPVGRKVYVKCKNLVIGNYHNYIQLGGYIDYSSNQPAVGNIPSNLISQVVIKGPVVGAPAPLKVRLSDLNASLQSMLVQIDTVEFTMADADEPFADIVTQNSLDRYVTECSSGDQLDVRSSNFSNFANLHTPSGNGSVIGIYSVYNTDNQLSIRDLSDVATMTHDRCDLVPVPFPAEHDVTIAEIRALYTGTTTTTPINAVITGTVISDYINKNENPNNILLEDATGGIIVRFTGAHSFKEGTKMKVRLKADQLTRFGGQLEVTPVSFTRATILGTDVVTPQTITIAELNANYYDYEAELIKLENVTLSSGSGLYSGNITVSDGTNTILLRVNPSPGSSANPPATFNTVALPTGAVDVVCYPNPFNSTYQIRIRNLSDVTPH